MLRLKNIVNKTTEYTTLHDSHTVPKLMLLKRKRQFTVTRICKAILLCSLRVDGLEAIFLTSAWSRVCLLLL